MAQLGTNPATGQYNSVRDVFAQNSRLSAPQRDEAYRLMKDTVSSGGKLRDVMGTLKENGVSYSQDAMAEDYQNMQAIAKIPDSEQDKQRSAVDYLVQVVQPFAEDNDLTTQAAYSELDDMKRNQEFTEDAADLFSAYTDMYPQYVYGLAEA